MATLDRVIASSVISKYLEKCGRGLSPEEHEDLLRIAQGWSCKQAADAAGLTYATLRWRRKKMFRKLRVSGPSELMATLLYVALELISYSA